MKSVRAERVGYWGEGERRRRRKTCFLFLFGLSRPARKQLSPIMSFALASRPHPAVASRRAAPARAPVPVRAVRAVSCFWWGGSVPPACIGAASDRQRGDRCWCRRGAREWGRRKRRRALKLAFREKRDAPLDSPARAVSRIAPSPYCIPAAPHASRLPHQHWFKGARVVGRLSARRERSRRTERGRTSPHFQRSAPFFHSGPPRSPCGCGRCRCGEFAR